MDCRRASPGCALHRARMLWSLQNMASCLLVVNKHGYPSTCTHLSVLIVPSLELGVKRSLSVSGWQHINLHRLFSEVFLGTCSNILYTIMFITARPEGWKVAGVQCCFSASLLKQRFHLILWVVDAILLVLRHIIKLLMYLPLQFFMIVKHSLILVWLSLSRLSLSYSVMMFLPVDLFTWGRFQTCHFLVRHPFRRQRETSFFISLIVIINPGFLLRRLKDFKSLHTQSLLLFSNSQTTKASIWPREQLLRLLLPPHSSHPCSLSLTLLRRGWARWLGVQRLGAYGRSTASRPQAEYLTTGLSFMLAGKMLLAHKTKVS